MFEMHQEKKPSEPLYHKISKGFLIVLSGIIMFFYLQYAVAYILSGPSITLLDDLTWGFVAKTLLLGVSLFFLVMAWFRHILYGCLSLGFSLFFVVYLSIITKGIYVDFLSGMMLFCAVGFIVLGLVKNYRKKHTFDLYAERIEDNFNGPDIFNFRL